jgi:hypothetical protein
MHGEKVVCKERLIFNIFIKENNNKLFNYCYKSMKSSGLTLACFQFGIFFPRPLKMGVVLGRFLGVFATSHATKGPLKIC